MARRAAARRPQGLPFELRLADPVDFRWLSGFEAVSPAHDRDDDQVALTQHDRFWPSDVLRACEAGGRMIQYPIRWHVVNPSPGVWDWSTVDGPIALIDELGVEPIVSLFELRTPAWLDGGVASPEFAPALAELCAAFARRYPWVRWYIPARHPSIAAGSLVTRPSSTTERDLQSVRALGNVAQGIAMGISAILAERSDARWILPDVSVLDDQRFLTHELIGGRVGPDYPLRDRLLANGLDAADLDWFEEHSAPLDVVGLDALAPADAGALARECFERLARPLILGATGAERREALDARDFDRLVREVRDLRGAGVPVIGMTWAPLIDRVAIVGEPGHRRHEIEPAGLFALEWRDERDHPVDQRSVDAADAAAFRLGRVPREVLSAWRHDAIASLDESVGPLTKTPANEELTLW